MAWRPTTSIFSGARRTNTNALVNVAKNLSRTMVGSHRAARPCETTTDCWFGRSMRSGIPCSTQAAARLPEFQRLCYITQLVALGPMKPQIIIQYPGFPHILELLEPDIIARLDLVDVQFSLDQPPVYLVAAPFHRPDWSETREFA